MNRPIIETSHSSMSLIREQVPLVETDSCAINIYRCGHHFLAAPKVIAVFVILDALGVLVGSVFAYWFAQSDVRMWLMLPVFAILVLAASGGYQELLLRRPEREIAMITKSVSLAVIILPLAINHFSLSTVLASWWAAFISTCAARTMAHVYARRHSLRGGTLFIGTEQEGLEFFQSMQIQGLQFLSRSTVEALISEGTELAEGSAVQRRLAAAICENHAKLVFIATGVAAQRRTFDDIIQALKALRTPFIVHSSTVSAHVSELPRSGSVAFYSRPSAWSLKIQRTLKRSLDIGIGLIGSLATVLLTPFVGLLIKLNDPGPVFYRSAYVAQDGSTQYYLKFRSMRTDADEILRQQTALREQFAFKHKLIADPRVTRVGRILRKYSIDEFPQFFSVVTGALSFVGPRTIRQEEKCHYGKRLPELLSVKPGMTGYWQTMGRQNTTYEQRVQMDMFYVHNWSLWLDIYLMFRTVWKVLSAEGAY